MKKFGYFLMLLFGCLILYCAAKLWQEGELFSSFTALLGGSTFIIVFGNLLIFGRVGRLGRLLGFLYLGHVDEEQPQED